MKNIQCDVGCPQSFCRFFSKQKWGDVVSTAEEETVTERTICLKCLVRTHEWEQKRDSFCIFYGLNVSISYKLAVIHQTADNNSDYWFHSTHPYVFYYRIGMFRAGYSKEQEKNIFSTFFLH